VADAWTPSEHTAGRLSRLRTALPRDTVWGWGIPVLITAVAAVLRFHAITRPGAKVFDEVYYSHDAWSLLHHGVELDAAGRNAGFVVHPPLGKWMIAFGELLYGNTPLGWRFSSAVVGSLSILLIARIARRMFRSTVLGCIAALLLSLDGLEFVQSRTSMLDIFLMFWVLAAFGCLVVDRDAGRRAIAEQLALGRSGDAIGSLGVRPWRIGCGICLGAAAATKWDGAIWLPLFVALAVWWDVGARRVAGDPHPIMRAAVRALPRAVLPFVVVPLAIYTLSWTGWFLSDAVHAWDHDRYVHAGQSWLAHDAAVLHGWFTYQREMWHFHTTLAASHPYLSNPWGWLLLARPVAYFYASPKGCGANACSQEVLGIGTPAIWWLSIPALLAVAWRMFFRFDWRAAAILLSFLAGYVIWLYDAQQVVPNCHPADNCHRTMFLFYLLPDVPFMVLALTMAIGMLLSARALRGWLAAALVAAYLGGVTWNFVYFYPVLSAQVITYDQWMDRMWLNTCDSDPKRDQHHETAPCWI
jgi:dolichyl-phosphate-mannose-protein mannosyltransferase